VAVEDAGFELRDSIAWIYGSGFPKSLDVSKAIDKRAGAEREVIGAGKYENRRPRPTAETNITGAEYGFGAGHTETAPSSPEAKNWQGWGTALKPAFEPVVVGRKPLVGTVAENVLAWGVGGLNIDGSRISTDELKPQQRGAPVFSETANGRITGFNRDDYEGSYVPNVQGRWPANVILDEVTAGLLDEQSGVTKSPSGAITQGGEIGKFGHGENGYGKRLGHFQGHGDSGGASRFFYVAKASKRDRNEGLEELEAVSANSTNWSGKGMPIRQDGTDRKQPQKQNFHPTVKPTALMRYLIKLVTPPGGTVLDPFTGSGSTGKAALLDGFQFVGVELTEEYLPIIEGRLRWASEQVEDEDDTLF